jgi:lipoprotein-releasing system permease protein
MNFPFFIARRYLFSKKSTHAINVISAISVIGVAVATMALVVTLSVFNGFHDMVASFFTSFDPQLKIVPAKGKTMPSDDPMLTQIKALPQIEVAMETVEDQALAVYQGRQAMVTIKGVEDNFSQLTHINEILLGDGQFELKAADMFYGIPGVRLAEQLGTGFAYDEPLQIYAPRREGQLNMANPMDGLMTDELYSPGVIFNVKQARYDKSYILTDIAFARRIFEQQGMLSALELRLKPGSNFEGVKSEIKKIVGENCYVRDRFEQQDDTFKIMKIEKLIAYIFLTFILMVACFNIIGLALCWAQQTFGLVKLGSSSGSFIINTYPVSVHPEDIILIFLTVLIVGFLAVWYPVRYFSRRLLA